MVSRGLGKLHRVEREKAAEGSSLVQTHMDFADPSLASARFVISTLGYMCYMPHRLVKANSGKRLVCINYTSACHPHRLEAASNFDYFWQNKIFGYNSECIAWCRPWPMGSHRQAHEIVLAREIAIWRVFLWRQRLPAVFRKTAEASCDGARRNWWQWSGPLSSWKARKLALSSPFIGCVISEADGCPKHLPAQGKTYFWERSGIWNRIHDRLRS